MHISHIQGGVAIQYQSVGWGQTDAFSKVLPGILKMHHLIKAQFSGRSTVRYSNSH